MPDADLSNYVWTGADSARQEGYSWDQADAYIGTASQAAMNEGYSEDDIKGALGYSSAQPFEDYSRSSWSNTIGNDPELQAAMLVDGQAPDLTANPDWRGTYANAVSQGHVTGPRDFSDRYAAQMVNAAGGVDLDSDTRARLTQSAAASADAMVPMLPDGRDFTDAALSFDPSDYDPSTVKQNLIDHWRATGVNPVQAAQMARQDPDLFNKLTDTREAPGFFDQLGTGVVDVLGRGAQFIQHLLPDGFVKSVNSLNDSLADMGVPLAKIGPDGFDAMQANREKMLAAQGYDGWGRTIGQIGASLPFFTTLGLEGLGGSIAAGATGGLAMGAFSPDDAPDWWAEKGRQLIEQGAMGAAGGAALHGLFKGIGAMIGRMTPEAAQALKPMAESELDPKVDVLNPGAEEPVTQARASEAFKPVEPAEIVEQEAAEPTVRLGEGTPDDTGLTNHHPLLDKTGADIGRVQITRTATGEANVDWIHANDTDEKVTGTANTVGPRDMRDLARRYLIDNPDVTAITGRRVTGGGLPRDVRFTRENVGAKIDPAATPAAKLARLAQIETEKTAPASFADAYTKAVDDGLMDADPATEKLADGHDAARGFRSYINDVLPSVMKDESGAMKPPAFRTPEQRLAADAKVENRNYIRELTTRTGGQMNQQMAVWTKRLAPLQKLLDPHMDEWTDAIGKGPAGTPGDTVIGKWLNYVEGRSKGVTFDPSHPLYPWADTVREFNQAMDKRLRQQAADGVLHYDGYIHDYFAHMFADPAAVFDKFGVSSGKLGAKGNLMERTGPPSIVDALNQGIPLKDPNPFNMILKDMHNKLAFSYSADMFDQATKDGMMRWSPKALPGDVEVGTSFGRKLFADAEGNAREIKLYGNPMLVKNLNHWLGQVHYSDTTAGFLDKLLYMKNTLTGLKLAAPMFHMITVGIGSTAGSIGQGIEELGRGQFLDALQTIVGAPFSTALNMRAGLAAHKAYLAGGDATIQHLVDQNFNFKGLNVLENYSGRTPSIFNSIMAGRSLGDWWQAPDSGMLPRELRNSAASILGDAKTEAEGYRMLRAPDRAVQFAVNEAGRVASVINGPFFEKVIPSIKLGQAYRRLDSYLRAYPTATPEQIAKYSRQITQDVDNRMGELQLDNVYWPRLAKVLANIATISTSWTYGSYRGFLAGMGYNLEGHSFEWNPVATSSLIGTLSTVAAANGLMTYMNTGKAPDSWRDWVNFKTGGIGSGLARGGPERGMIPSELKELFDIGTIIAKSFQEPTHAAGATVDYAMGKLNPMWQGVRALVTGQDGIGHNIAEMPGGWRRFAEDQLKPIFLNQLDQRTKTTGLTKLENVIGMREAPKWAEAWDSYQGWQQKNEAKLSKQEIARARGEVSQLGTTPWWGKNLPQPKGRQPNHQQRAMMQFDATGSMKGITNPRIARYLSVLQDYRKERMRPDYDPVRDQDIGNTLQQRLQRARKAGPFDPVKGY